MTVTTNVRARVGRRTVLIDAASGGETAADLAEAFGFGSLRIDGRLVPDACPLVVSGLVDGSELSDGDAVPHGSDEDAPARPVWTATVVTGPDCGQRTHLPAGRHVIGRAGTAAVCIDDEQLEPHHALLHLGDDATDEMTLVQLAGATAVRLERTAEGAMVWLGASRLEIRPATDASAEAPARPSADRFARPSPWRRDHHRPLRPPAPALAAAIEVPDCPAAIGAITVPAAIVPTILAACGTAVVAVVLHQPLIMLFGLSAVLVALGTWAAQHVSRLRRERSARIRLERVVGDLTSAIAEQAAADTRWLHLTTPDVAAAIERITTGSPRLWERRPAHGDAWRVVLGRGEQPWHARLEGDVAVEGTDLADAIATRSVLADVPIAVDLAPGAVVGVTGGRASGVVRSMVVQLAANSGPADWELLVVADRPERWAWTAWLPHDVSVVAPGDAAIADAPAGGERARHLVVIVESAGALASRTSPLRRLLASDPAPAAVVVATDVAALPSFCTAVLGCGARPGVPARWFADPAAAELPIPVHTAAITTRRATDAAARLAHRHDPESECAGGAAPAAIDMMTALGGSVGSGDAIARGWERRGGDPAPVALIGAAGDGTVEIDLCRDGPHALIGGTTGAGKSELLRTLLVGLAVESPPELLSFVLVDYKGGAAFDACADLPHVAGIVTDLDDHLAARALRSLDAELRRRERLLRDVGASDLTAHRALTGGRDPLARLVVVVDEFATLATELPGFLASLVGIAQRGRSLGVHLVLATQRPGAAINDDIRGNTNLRIALRVQDANEAMDIVGDRAPAGFGRTAPGRAMLRLGSDERVLFQVATTGGPAPTEQRLGLGVCVDGEHPRGLDPADVPTQLETLVARIRDAAADRAPARPIWEPVLPSLVTADELTSTAQADTDAAQPDPCVGVIDDADAQRRRPLRWAHRDGHLVIAGALGSGTTTAALAVVRGLTARLPPEALHVYVLDGRSDHELRSLDAVPHCAGVIGLTERERLERAVRVLHARTRARAADAADVVLLIDGLPAIRSAIDAIGGDLHERFDEVVADGPAAGVTVIATTDQPLLPLALAARSSQRWIMRLADPTAASLLDLAAAEAVASDAPPGRLVALPERMQAHVAAPDVTAAWRPLAGNGPARIEVLPVHLPAQVLERGCRSPGSTHLPIGLGAGALEVVAIDLADGDHALVIGTSRSGRSTALVRLAIAWSEAHPDAPVTTITPRRSALTAAALDRSWATSASFDAEAIGGGRHLLVVDDAELVDHAALPALCSTPGVTVLAASRPDALRATYQHWTHHVRRCRTGLVLGRTTEMDGDQFGVVLPRRWPAPHAPGRGWLVADGACLGVVQLATDLPP